MVDTNDGNKAAELYVKRDLGNGKGAAWEIRKAWRGRRRQVRRGVRRLGRGLWVLGYWDGDK